METNEQLNKIAHEIFEHYEYLCDCFAAERGERADRYFYELQGMEYVALKLGLDLYAMHRKAKHETNNN